MGRTYHLAVDQRPVARTVAPGAAGDGKSVVIDMAARSERGKAQTQSTSGDAEGKLIALLELVGAGDQIAFATFYDSTAPRALSLALRITRRREIAEEVLSDVYMDVWSKATRFDATAGSPLAWLMTICRNRALDAMRRRQRHAAALDRFESQGNGSPALERSNDPQDLMQAVEADSSVWRALGRLSNAQRQLLSLAFFRGYSHAQIAQFSSTPIGTVKSQIRRALETLRSSLRHSQQSIVGLEYE